MNHLTSNSAIPFAIARKLRLVRQRKLWVHVASSVVAAAAVLLGAMAVSMLIDYLATLYDSRWRILLTTAALGAAAFTAAGWLAVAWRRLLGWDRIAADVDRQIPQLEQRWTTMTRLGDDAANADVVHPAMLRRLSAEAASWEPHVEAEQVVSLSAVTRTLIGLTAVTAVLGIAVVIDSRQTLALMHRFWRPAANISATQLVDLPGDIVIGRGEPITLAAAVEGKPVERATLFLSPEGNLPQTIPLVAHGRETIQFSHRLRAVEQPFAYRFRAGDGQTDWHSVTVADRPEIAQLSLTVTPPAYTRQAAKTFDKLPPRLSAMQSSELELSVRPKAPVERVQARLHSDEHIDFTPAANGSFRWQTTLEESFSLAIVLTESHGLTNRRVPQCQINVYPDKPPVVKILAPDDQVAVRPDDTLQITFSASDDVGIESAELLVYDEAAGLDAEPIVAIPIPLGDDQPVRTVHQAVELDLSQFTLNDGSELSYQIRVREFRGTDAQPAPTTAAATDQPPAESGTGFNPSDSREPTAESRQPTATSTAASETARDASPQTAARETRSESTPTAPTSQTAADARPTSPPPEHLAASSPRAGDSPQSPATPDPSDKSPQPTADSQQPANAQSADNTAARTATSQRQGLASQREPSETEDAATSPTSPAQPNATPADGENENQPPTVNSQQPIADSQQPPSDSPTPGDRMPRRALDVPQESSSSRMRLKIDEWAGSFSGQQRAKLEMAIAPELEALDEALAKAQRIARGVLDQLEADSAWRPAHDREVAAAERSTVEAQRTIDKLQQRAHDTPYAFIGLQVADIGVAHVAPARGNFWKALQSNGDGRSGLVRDAWQHLGRARELVAELRGQFERARREFELAEAVERVKKMYQVYLENSHTLLQIRDDDPRRYQRNLAEFDLDDEYLERLREVLEMRRDLHAELARILAEDPRLLRRFMDALRHRSNNLREELARLSDDQERLNREVRAWSVVAEADRPRIAKILLMRHVQDAAKISEAAGELQSRYQAWLPLARQSQDADLAAATRLIQDVATASSELSAAATEFVAQSNRVQQVVRGSPDPAPATDDPPPNPAESLDPLLAGAQRVYERLGGLEVALRQLAAREAGPEEALFAANRLVETRRLVADTSAWIRQTRAHKDGNYPAAAEVDQYRLAMKTDELAGKLAAIEQTLSGLVGSTDGTLPEPIAQKAREFLTTLDREASPNQLAAVYALRSKQLPRAGEHQKAAGDALTKAEKLYDDLMRLAIEEMDKLPVQDPIAELLNDPTLDEILAQLEQELPLAELLGIPCRPSNLRIVGDWLRPGGGANMGGSGRMAMNQVRQDQDQARQRLDEAYRRAIARALKETRERRRIETPETVTLSDWNRLLSQLGDDLRQGRDKAPPEQYRRAIEQYFAQITRAAAETEEDKP